jgi:tetratricopeptide (TPR) repeat protein
LDPEAADAHLVRAIFFAFYEYNWTAAGEHFAKALELDPASARVRTIRSLWFLICVGRLDEALAETRLAVSLDPLSPAVRNVEIWVLHVMRKEEAVERARAALQLFPSRWVLGLSAGLVFMQHGLHEDAATALENGLEIMPGGVHLLGALALARARQGRPADAENIRAELEELASRQYVPFFPRAHASEACGDMDRAYCLLDQALEEREPIAVLLTIDRRAERQADPRHQALLRKMNLA